MLTFKNMSLTVYKRDTGEAMVSLRADNNPGDARPEGLSYISFYMTLCEMIDLFTGNVSSISDGYHNVLKSGECYTFFDLDGIWGRATAGSASVPYTRLHIPHHVARILMRAVRMRLRSCEGGGERLTIDIPESVRRRWNDRYGQGTGVVNTVWTNDETVAMYDNASKNGGETFTRCINQLRTIAANSTYRATDRASVRLSKDWDGFYFTILTPAGTAVMHGGVVNHGKDGAHDWSVHT